MKCGTDTQSDRVFCDTCLAAMQRSPVKPGTPIQLPTHTTSVPKKATAKRKQPTAEEKLLRTRRALRITTVGLICALLALGLSISLLVHALQQEPETPVPLGRNYTTSENGDGN